MRQESHIDRQALERLSALTDGELERAAVADLCAAWRDAPSARVSWHAWHLIGDVLRSEDLCSDARRDAAFLHALRTRMSGEAIVLAPAAASPASEAPGARLRSTGTGRSGRTGWRRFGALAAVAAGFVAVVAVVLDIQAPGPLPAAQTLVAVPDASVRAVAGAAPAASIQQEAPANGKLIRDARLDRYLAAHKQFGGSTALGVPSGFMRSATVEVPSR